MAANSETAAFRRNHHQPLVSNRLPNPRLTKVYRLEATLAQPFDLGDIVPGHRRIVPLTGGTFTGPELTGSSSQAPAPIGRSSCLTAPRWATSATRFRRTAALCSTCNGGAFVSGSPEVLARLARGEDVDAREYTFRASTQIETAVVELDWLNKGVFISVGGRQPGGVIYETYLVG